VASAAPVHLATQSSAMMQAAALVQAKQTEGALAARVLARREAAQDRRQEARQDRRQAVRAAALAAAQAARAAARQARRAAAAPAPVPASSAPTPAGSLQQYAMSIFGSQYSCAAAIIDRESGWNVYAQNPYSGAYGIPQALPGSKMASAGADWATNGDTQLRWMLSYVNGTYGGACAAWSFWQANGSY
jgi:soluble lytic murein transglycosylase-like protein